MIDHIMSKWVKSHWPRAISWADMTPFEQKRAMSEFIENLGKHFYEPQQEQQEHSSTKKHSYNVTWSKEDKEFVATCDSFPSLSYLDPDPVKAIQGLTEIVNDIKI